MEESANGPKEILLPYIDRLLGNQSAEFMTYYASRETQTPLVLPQEPGEDPTGQLPMQVYPELSEGLDLEARRARDIVRRGLSAFPERLRDMAGTNGEDT